MIDYDECEDITLQKLASEGDRTAEEALAKRYMCLVRACARPLFLAGGDSEDLIQEGMMGLINSMQTYSEDRLCSFRSYAELCIKRRILSAIKAANRLKHTPLNSGLSLDELYSEDDGSYDSENFILQ